jgi:hypothetical protein
VLAREVGNRRGEGTALGNIGMVQGALGRTDSALVYYRQSGAPRFGSRLPRSGPDNPSGDWGPRRRGDGSWKPRQPREASRESPTRS